MADRSWPEVLGPLTRGQDLDTQTAAWAMTQVMSGEASDAQLGGFLLALRTKGETAQEMTGLAASMLAAAHRIEVPGPALDVVGTGGDMAHTVNISTMAALVAAGAGARIVKHGNRAASSSCGTADVLEELGIPLDLTPDQVVAVAEQAGITFCFARNFHPAMKYAGAVRAQLGVPTFFNFLGPLANPAQPGAMAIGCADSRMAGVMADVLAERGTAALVFRGDDGLDELTTTATSRIWEVAAGTTREWVLDPTVFGIAPATPESLRGGDAAYNAGVVRELLAGAAGPVRDAVLLNAAAALIAHDAASTPPTEPLPDRFPAALARAATSIDTGAAAQTLQTWLRTTAQAQGR